MIGIPASASPATSRLPGTIRSWLRIWPGKAGQSSDHLLVGAKKPHAPCAAAVRVLVVDENPVKLIVVWALMHARRLVPVLAADGHETLALACERHFDLILKDLPLPNPGHPAWR